MHQRVNGLGRLETAVQTCPPYDIHVISWPTRFMGGYDAKRMRTGQRRLVTIPMGDTRKTLEKPAHTLSSPLHIGRWLHFVQRLWDCIFYSFLKLTYLSTNRNGHFSNAENRHQSSGALQIPFVTGRHEMALNTKCHGRATT